WMGLNPDDLAGGRLGTGDLALEELRDRPRAEVLEALRIDPELGDLLPHHGVLGEDAAFLLHAPSQLDEAVERDAQPDLEPESKRQELVHQRGEPDLPAVVEAAEDLGLVYAHVVEEDFVELGITRDLAKRLERHGGQAHVEQG